MNRRALLSWAAASTLSVTAGCLGSASTFNLDASQTPDESRNSISEIATDHPDTGVSGEYARADQTESSSGDPYSLTDLSLEVQREVLIAITRGKTWNWLPIELANLDPPAVEYSGELFLLELSTNTVGETPDGTSEDSPQPDYNWKSPLELDATLKAGELTLTITNTSDDSTKIDHYGRPYFGVLFAWDGDPHTLGHDNYEENEAIVTNGDVISFDNTASPTTLELAPGESIEETYTVPEGIEEGATIWFDIPIVPERHAAWTVTIGS